MRSSAICLLAIAATSLVMAQQPANVAPASLAPANLASANPGTDAVASAADLAAEKIGANDVIGITVYDAPELSHSYRVDTEGDIRMPMVRQRIHAAGLLAPELENAISNALVDEHVMVSPIVTVGIVEYHSHPITVVGAVRNPTTFQAAGPTTLLDAIIRAGGVTENAGAEITVSRPPASGADQTIPLARRVSVRALLDGTDPSANLILAGGETIRVRERGRIYLVGNVKRPGPFTVPEDESESSIMRALSIAGGLDSFASHTAYIYRYDNTGRKSEIPVNIHKILARKAPDVPLYPNDMLYVPNATLSKNGWLIFEASSAALGIASFALFATQ